MACWLWPNITVCHWWLWSPCQIADTHACQAWFRDTLSTPPPRHPDQCGTNQSLPAWQPCHGPGDMLAAGWPEHSRGLSSRSVVVFTDVPHSQLVAISEQDLLLVADAPGE